MDNDGGSLFQKLDKHGMFQLLALTLTFGSKKVTPCFVTSGNLRQRERESRIFPRDNIADDSKTAQFEYCAVRQSVGWEPTARKFFESSSVDALWCRAASPKESFTSFHTLTTPDCPQRAQPSSVDAFHGLQLPPPLKIESLLAVPSYSLAFSVVDDSLCDHFLFGVKPHSRYDTSNVAPASVSLPIDSATTHAVTWCHLTCNAKLDALTGFHLNEHKI
ncbi:uncharacterized protein TNCV_3636141 [Trichonephila clavipes]|nr:uncharacterized protein TNCV_3636141 [Trichonephila clavipes]